VELFTGRVGDNAIPNDLDIRHFSAAHHPFYIHNTDSLGRSYHKLVNNEHR
jgi:hypothetical protein